MNKKALSPLTSTILLIMFAGALGGAVMTWGSTTYSEEKHAAVNCENVKLQIVSINNKPEVCIKGNNLDFMINNIGQKEIQGLKITIIGEKDINEYSYDNNIAVAEVIRSSAEFDPNLIGNIKKIIFVPKTDFYCAANSAEVDNIAAC